MERNFYNDDFERLIRQKADQYKMYPSDQVWKGIHKSLHGRKKWRWAGLAILLLSIGSYTGNWYFSGKPAGQLANNLQPSISAANKTFPKDNSSAAAGQSPAYNNPQATDRNSNNTRSNNTNTTSETNFIPTLLYSIIPSAGNDQVQANVLQNSITEEKSFVIINDPWNIHSDADAEMPLKGKNAQTAEDKNAINTSLADASSESVLAGTRRQNWLEEMALFQLAPQKPKRFGLTMYFSPTVNYRKLTGSASFPSSVKSIPLVTDVQGDVDQYVKHKPALGFEFGGNVLYRASRRINFKAGLQFNYSRYNIEAFASQPEVATIALSSSQAFLADTISTVSNIRNLSGYAQENLSNQYFQLSMPVGIEFRVMGTDKLQLNVAGTIQPTYLLNRNSYLITTDYKNYMREPSLVRRWNVNGGLETYVSYHTGSVRWQVGPQFRYQLLSSYSRKYPIKEQLMEYGIKIGVSKTLR